MTHAFRKLRESTDPVAELLTDSADSLAAITDLPTGMTRQMFILERHVREIARDTAGASSAQGNGYPRFDARTHHLRRSLCCHGVFSTGPLRKRWRQIFREEQEKVKAKP
jgi:hypothetical protein